jgi:hypothetical protein
VRRRGARRSACAGRIGASIQSARVLLSVDRPLHGPRSAIARLSMAPHGARCAREASVIAAEGEPGGPPVALPGSRPTPSLCSRHQPLHTWPGAPVPGGSRRTPWERGLGGDAPTDQAALEAGTRRSRIDEITQAAWSANLPRAERGARGSHPARTVSMLAWRTRPRRTLRPSRRAAFASSRPAGGPESASSQRRLPGASGRFPEMRAHSRPGAETSPAVSRRARR